MSHVGSETQLLPHLLQGALPSSNTVRWNTAPCSAPSFQLQTEKMAPASPPPSTSFLMPLATQTNPELCREGNLGKCSCVLAMSKQCRYICMTIGFVVQSTLTPHGLQHTRHPCPSPSLEFAQTHIHWVSDALPPSHPLSSPCPPAFNLSQHQGLFQWISSLHQVAKVLEFQLQHQSFQWIFRVDFL